MVRKKTLSELDQAEIKLESLLEKRDALNQEAQLARGERDMVHDKKRELSAKLREIKDRRGSLAAEARAHRSKRDEYQVKAKSLIELKRKLRTHGGASASEELRNLKRQTQAMELKQQTASLSLAAENDLIDQIKEHLKRVKELQVLKDEQDKISKEVKDLDGTITDLFAKADAEHKIASELSARAQAVHQETIELVQEISALIVEGNAKHEAYLEARGKADEVHAKVVEMRDKVLSIRGAKRAEAREARDLLRTQNRSVRRALYDEKKLEEAADQAVKALLQKGRVEI
ncbi:MAG TPA: hypothetical protein VEY12_06685 [Thermoplasmata archaeon]|nr:hypothetical protein [Thermoplasmata archaeon]